MQTSVDIGQPQQTHGTDNKEEHSSSNKKDGENIYKELQVAFLLTKISFFKILGHADCHEETNQRIDQGYIEKKVLIGSQGNKNHHDHGFGTNEVNGSHAIGHTRADNSPI